MSERWEEREDARDSGVGGQVPREPQGHHESVALQESCTPKQCIQVFKFPEIDANSGWCKQKQNLLKDYARAYSIQQKIREPDVENNKSQVIYCWDFPEWKKDECFLDSWGHIFTFCSYV